MLNRLTSGLAWLRGLPAPAPLHLAAAGLLLAVLCRPIYDSDLPWQLRTGEMILESQSLPEHEPFLADRAHGSFTPVAWAGQVVYAVVRLIGGWPLLHVVDGLLWVGSFAVVALHARRLGASTWAAGIALAFGGYAAFSSVSTRPQTFGVLAFGTLVGLVGDGKPGWRRCFLAAALLVLWQNLHPSAAIGVFWLGALCVVAWLRRFRRSGPTPWPLSLLTLASPFSVLATPGGIELLRVSQVNAEISLWMEINEWLPLWQLELNGDHRIEACVGLLVFGIVLAFRRRALLAEQVLPAVVLAVMAVGSYRFVLFWAAAAVSVWASGFTRPSSASLTPRPWDWPTRFALVVGWATAVIVPSLIYPTHLRDDFPHDAVSRLKQEKPEGTIYCDLVWGGILVDEGSHAWRVSHDGRYYMRSKAEWNEYYAAAVGDTPVYAIVHRWEPVAFVLRVGYEDGLIALLRSHPDWRELVRDRDCVVFVRATSR